MHRLIETPLRGQNVSFETPIAYQFPMKLPTDLLFVIIPAKYMILKSKLLQNRDFTSVQQFKGFIYYLGFLEKTFTRSKAYRHVTLLVPLSYDY